MTNFELLKRIPRSKLSLKVEFEKQNIDGNLLTITSSHKPYL